MNKLFLCLALFGVLSAEDCPSVDNAPPPQAASGARQTSVQVQKQSNGLTTEQTNVRDRLVEDNKPGAIKHLYVFSAFSGQVLLYSTVRGKVTSSGKRLNPTSVAVSGGRDFRNEDGYAVNGHWTSEAIQDDGTYGSSVEYVYWWDTKGVYHQHYVQGGQILHVSSQPLNVPHVVINLNEVR